MRITKVTTKTGDMGQTGLANGERVSKNSPRIHAIGSVDTLNSFIGWTRVNAKKNIDKSLSEAFRVLRPGGRFFCLEFSKVENENLDLLYSNYSKFLP